MCRLLRSMDATNDQWSWLDRHFADRNTFAQHISIAAGRVARAMQGQNRFAAAYSISDSMVDFDANTMIDRITFAPSATTHCNNGFAEGASVKACNVAGLLGENFVLLRQFECFRQRASLGVDDSIKSLHRSPGIQLAGQLLTGSLNRILYVGL